MNIINYYFTIVGIVIIYLVLVLPSIFFKLARVQIASPLSLPPLRFCNELTPSCYEMAVVQNGQRSKKI
jgi:hypothetical protein